MNRLFILIIVLPINLFSVFGIENETSITSKMDVSEISELTTVVGLEDEHECKYIDEKEDDDFIKISKNDIESNSQEIFSDETFGLNQSKNKKLMNTNIKNIGQSLLNVGLFDVFQKRNELLLIKNKELEKENEKLKIEIKELKEQIYCDYD